MLRLLSSRADLAVYDAWVKNHPQGTLWQSLEWKAYQEALGRGTKIYAALEDKEIRASAMVVIDRTWGGMSTWDAVRGPLWSAAGTETVTALLRRILEDAKRDGCLALYISSPQNVPYEDLKRRHTAHTRCEQLEATVVIDLRQTEEQILANMHQKARYNIKVATKHGVCVRQHASDDEKALDCFHTLVRQTSARDGFTHLSRAHYGAFLGHLKESFLMLAWHEDTPVAGLIGIIWPMSKGSSLGTGSGYSHAQPSPSPDPNSRIGIYYYGASSHEHRALMAPSLLQWEAMLHCKARGCHAYDLLGIAPDNAPKDNPWSGITEFKRKFGGTVVTYPPEQQIVLRPWAWRVLQWKRKLLG